MVLFTIAVTFNCVAILAIALNAIHEAICNKRSENYDSRINLIGFLYLVAMVLSFYLYKNANSLAATVISAAMAIPVAGTGVYLFFSTIRKPG